MRPALTWNRADPTKGEVSRPLMLTEPLTFAVGADRLCVGVWRAGRRIACAARTSLRPEVRGGRCPDCDRLDRSSSIAADTRLDDPRTFRVYLAHHGPDRIKVGITAAERGHGRLLEQGAFASVFLLEGSLLAARAAENRLHTALALPDRVAIRDKRTARTALDAPMDRRAALDAAAGEAARQPAWPFGMTPCTTGRSDDVSDYTDAYGLPAEGLRPDAELGPLTPTSVITGDLVCAIGTDLYVRAAPGLVLVDTQRLLGWALRSAPPDSSFTASTRPPQPLRGPRPGEEPEALF